MIEVEVKLPVADLAGIRTELLKTGFKETGFIEERDTYFDNKQGDISANGEALRVRETKDFRSGKSRAQINFKGKKLDGRTMTRKELEILVSSEEEKDAALTQIENILDSLGYQISDTVRTSYLSMLQKR